MSSVRRDLGAGAGEPDELEAGAEELRRTAFVSGDMQLGMTEHDAPGRGDVCERQRIGRGPGRHQEHRHVALENLGEAPFDRGGPRVGAIAGRKPLVRAHDGVEDFGCYRRRVVAGKVHCRVTREATPGGR